MTSSLEHFRLQMQDWVNTPGVERVVYTELPLRHVFTVFLVTSWKNLAAITVSVWKDDDSVTVSGNGKHETVPAGFDQIDIQHAMDVIHDEFGFLRGKELDSAGAAGSVVGNV